MVKEFIFLAWFQYIQQAAKLSYGGLSFKFSRIMSLRKSQRRQPQPEQQPTEEEYILTEQEPLTSTKVAEGSVHQLRDDNESDPVIKDAAEFEVLERSRPKLTKVAEGSILKSLHQLKDDDESDPIIRNAAKVLERSRRLNYLSRKEWYTLLRTVRDSSNNCKELTQILNEIDTGAAGIIHVIK